MEKLQATEQHKSKQNWLFNVLKFLFACFILFGHTLPMVGGGYQAHSSYIFVDGFLFISGLFLYKTATTKKTNTFKYMGRKYLSLLPAIIFGAIVALISVCINMAHAWNWNTFGTYILKFICDLIPIQLVWYNNQDFWFLVVLLWSCFLFYPLVKKFPRAMPWVCLCVFLGCYLYNIIQVGSAEPWGIMSQNDWFMDLWLFLRGFAGISCGIFIAGLSTICKVKVQNKNWQAVFSTIFVILLVAATAISFATYHTNWDFVVILLLQIMCFIVWNKITYFNANYDFKLPTHLAGVSLYMYVCHHRLNDITIKFINSSTISSRFIRLMLVCLIAIALALIVYFGVYFSKKAIAKRKLNKKLNQTNTEVVNK